MTKKDPSRKALLHGSDFDIPEDVHEIPDDET